MLQKSGVGAIEGVIERCEFVLRSGHSEMIDKQLRGRHWRAKSQSFQKSDRHSLAGTINAF